MSLLVKGWKDHRLSIKKDCQSHTARNSTCDLYNVYREENDAKNEALLSPYSQYNNEKWNLW